jgi:hypothetical protein
MKQVFLLLILLGLGVWAYLHFRSDTPPPTEPHLARQGTFFVLEYVSVPAAHGVIGFEPGREVHFVRADHDKGLLVVTDGEHEVEMKPSQLTNDLDMAALARKDDESSQQQIKAFIEHEKAIYLASTRAADIRYAQELERAKNRSNASPGAGSPSPPEPAYAGPPNHDPYSYLSSPH